MTRAPDLRIDGERLWSSLMEMAEIGATPGGGSNRQALTDEDKKGRDLFVTWCEEAGCTVRVDEIGNLFARRPGQPGQERVQERGERGVILAASHLDTQPAGGRFDGVLGVLAGLEVLRTLNDHEIETERPFEVASWTNEEGARFAPAMMGSGVWAGVFDLEETKAIADHDGKTVGGELERIGYRGERPARPHPIAASFELHIEQGPVLEQAKKQIGIVTGVQAIRWLDVLIEGHSCHAGTTPMAARQDPMRALAAFLPRLYREAEQLGPDVRLTFGDLRVHPGSRNTVPDRLDLAVDVRHPESAVLDRFEEALRRALEEETSRASTRGEVPWLWDCAAVEFDPGCVGAVREATETLDLPAMEMPSGAGHDAVFVAGVAPTSMIFVPCAGGLSHNERESIEPADAEAGCNVLLHAMLARDRDLGS